MKEVRVFFEDQAGKTQAWDTVAIPVSGTLPTNFNALAVEMNICGQNVRSTRLYKINIHMTSSTTFELNPGETRILGLTGGEIASDGKLISLTITHLPYPEFGVVASCRT